MAALLALFALACATRHQPSIGPLSAPPGYRLLYQAEAQTPTGTTHFKMAAAVRPPDRLRLEFFGPIGGVRLLLTTDGSEAHAVFPRQRLYDHAPATPRALARLTGLRFEPAGLVALLQGQPPCEASDVGPAPAGPDDEDRTLRCRLDDALVELRVGDTRWARSIAISLETLRKSIHLELIEGPTEADLADELFKPSVPQGYARGNLLGDGQPLLIVDEPAQVEGARP